MSFLAAALTAGCAAQSRPAVVPSDGPRCRPMTAVATVFTDGPFEDFDPMMTPDPGSAVAYGYVRDRDTRLPLEQVQVLIPDRALGELSDDEGRYVIRLPVAGANELDFTRIGYVTESITFDTDQGLSRLDIELQPCPISIR